MKEHLLAGQAHQANLSAIHPEISPHDVVATSKSAICHYPVQGKEQGFNPHSMHVLTPSGIN